MAQPTPYDRQFSFQDFQAQEPTTPLPGDEVDGELNAVKLTIDQTLVNLAKIQRDDGALKNGIVTQDALSDSLSIGFTYRGSWESGVNYLISDGASVGSTFYKAKSSHLSSGANQPPNATYWDQIADFTPLAIGIDSVFTAAIQDGAVTEPKHATGGVSTRALADSGVTEPKHATGGVSTRALADSSVTTAKLADANTTNAKLANMAAATLKGSVAGGVPADLTVAQAQSLLGIGRLGQCYLSKSGANLLLLPQNGNLISIDGVLESIPAAGVVLAATSLTPGTDYFIYAYMNAGVMTLEPSTTAFSIGSVAPHIGWPIKNGDASRTLVAHWICTTGPAWLADSGANIGGRSYFNRKRKTAVGRFTANRTVAAGGAAAEVNTEIRVVFTSFGDDEITFEAQGGWQVTGAGTAYADIGVNSTLPAVARQACTATGTATALNVRQDIAVAVGDHNATIMASMMGGTNVTFLGGTNGEVTLAVHAMG